MKKLLFLMLLLVSMTVCAENPTKNVGSVILGSSYDEALVAMKSDFGEPSSISDKQVEFKNKMFNGQKFDRVVYSFKNGKLSRIQFIAVSPNKALAKAKMLKLVGELGKTHTLSQDQEDGGGVFYVGGIAPSGIGRLFTVSTFASAGKWNTELRYGPF